jgi:hypothetical protein
MSKQFSMNFIEMMVAVWYILKANHELKTPPDIHHTATIISMKFIENCFDMDVFIILLVIICFKFSGSAGSFLVLHSTIYKFVPAFSIYLQ